MFRNFDYARDTTEATVQHTCRSSGTIAEKKAFTLEALAVPVQSTSFRNIIGISYWIHDSLFWSYC